MKKFVSRTLVVVLALFGLTSVQVQTSNANSLYGLTWTATVSGEACNLNVSVSPSENLKNLVSYSFSGDLKGLVFNSSNGKFSGSSPMGGVISGTYAGYKSDHTILNPHEYVGTLTFEVGACPGTSTPGGPSGATPAPTVAVQQAVVTLTCNQTTNGGLEDTTLTATAGQSGSVCPAPAERPGYTFTGWFTQASGGTSVSFPLTISANTTVYARWSTNTYTLTCDQTTNGGIANTTVTFTTGQSGVTCPAPAERPGYAFTGWFTQASGGTSVSFPLTISANTTVYARWSANTYTLTCDQTTNGGAANTTVTATTGQAGVTCPAPAVRPGYTFTGWFTQASGGTSVSFPLTISANTTVYARWSANTYTLTCDQTTNGGAANTTVTATTGQAGVTCPAPAARPGYTFTGWFTQASGGDLVSLPLVLKNNTTIFGRWTADVVVTKEDVVVYFKWDSSKLSTNAKNDLKEFVKSIPTNASDIEIDVTGFAQIARSRTYDLKLSLKRAQAIVSYLRSLGVQATFTTTGMGWENDSPESRRGDIQIEYTLNP